MGANAMCVTSNGGIPLFTRHVGNVEPLTFSSIASLNGVHIFTKSHGMKLISTKTEVSTVIWKEYEESVVLIALSLLNDENILGEVLDAVFDSMILSVGIDEIKTIKNVERLKRELKPSYGVIDKILECLDFGDRCIGSSTQILKYVETILCSEKASLQVSLETFCESVSSLYGCIMVEGAIALATQAWWDLEHIERKLLSHVILVNIKSTAFDVPLFLPTKSPNVPLRLVGVCLIAGLWVCALCGPKPDLSSFQQTAFQAWSPLTPVLKLALNSAPRGIPSSLPIHPSVLGFLIIDINIGKYLSSICSTLNRKESRSPSEVLKTFYYQAGRVLLRNDLTAKPLETYWCSEYHKVHGLRKGDVLLCLMYNASVPTHTMRLMSEETFKTLAASDW